jgi:acyl-CoA synthetase (AMP-forming)/AMP-acid ligase II
MHGRSDDTIKVAGKRIGPAEVEAAVVAHESASEAAAIGVPDSVKGEAIVVFVVLTIVSASEVSLRRDLEADIATSLEREARLVSNALPADSTEWEATVKRLRAESGLRITLIDSAGRVRAESDVPEEGYQSSRTTRIAPR